jgi:hypothetical protein
MVAGMIIDMKVVEATAAEHIEKKVVFFCTIKNTKWPILKVESWLNLI